MILADLGKRLVLTDRCTVWLYNPMEHQLWTIVAHGVDRIVIPADSGFVGHSFTTGELTIVEDAYEDPILIDLFLQHLDKFIHIRNEFSDTK